MIFCLLGRHDWSTLSYSGRGVIAGYRKCVLCSTEQTLIYDFRGQEHRWVKGKFVSDRIGEPMRVFVFAGSVSSFQEVVEEMSMEVGNTYYIWMVREENWRELDGYPHPSLVLPPDWKDNPLTDDYRFRLLLTTGHT